MAKKRNSSQQQSGRKSQTTMSTIIVAIVGLIFWWFTGSSPDAFLNNGAETIGATPTVQEVAQASDEVDAPIENAVEPDIETASEETIDGNGDSANASTDEAAETTPPKPTNTAVPRPRGPPGIPEIHIDDLPPEARDTIDLIFSGGPYPFDRDGITFQNREGILPDRNRGYYEEYTVITPGLSHRGARRIVIGREDEMYYTDDHYESFSWIAED